MACKKPDLSTADVIRMNLSQFEQAVERRDQGTAQRCVDAAEIMFRGLRAETSGAKGVEVGPPVWAEGAPIPREAFDPKGAAGWKGGPPPADFPTPELAPIPPPAAVPVILPPAPEPIDDAVRRVLRAEWGAILPARSAPWVTRLERREWTWGVLARLTWALICCAAALGWRGVRRALGFGGGK